MKRLFSLLHRWLGLVSGLIVMVVCLTGSLYVFRDEVEAVCEPWRRVPVRDAEMLPPSALLKATGEASALTLGTAGEAARLDAYTPQGTTTTYVDPYTGEVLKVIRREPGDAGFFAFLLDGHRNLWLPRSIGGPLVSYAVLVFFLALVTGLVVSWPKRWNRKAVQSHFTFHRPLRAARFRLDLHNVLGFYATLPLLVLCLTGLLFGLSWFSGGLYRLVSGGQVMQGYSLPSSDSTNAGADTPSIDLLHARLKAEEPDAVQFYYALPQTASGVYRVSIVHERGSYYKQDNRFFDRYTLRERQDDAHEPRHSRGPYLGYMGQDADVPGIARRCQPSRDGIPLVVEKETEESLRDSSPGRVSGNGETRGGPCRLLKQTKRG